MNTKRRLVWAEPRNPSTIGNTMTTMSDTLAYYVHMAATDPDHGQRPIWQQLADEHAAYLERKIREEATMLDPLDRPPVHVDSDEQGMFPFLAPVPDPP